MAGDRQKVPDDDVPWDSEAVDLRDVDPLTRRRVLSIMAAGASATALAGCAGGDGDGGDGDGGGGGGGDDSGDGDGDGGYGGGSDGDGDGGNGDGSGGNNKGEYVQTVGVPFAEFDPATNVDYGIRALANTHDPLVWMNLEGNQEVHPALAKSWDVSDDGLEWTFNLREGVKFHGGYGEMTAEDVKFTFNRMLEMGRGVAYLWDPLESIETPDDYTAVFKCESAWPLDLVATSPFGSWVISKEGYQDHGESYEEQHEYINEGHEIGTGPYTIEEFSPQQHLKLEKFDDYWAGWDMPHFSSARYRYVSEASTKVQLIKSGEVDELTFPPINQISSLEDDPNVKLVVGEVTAMNQIGFFNARKEPTDDVNVRRALRNAFPYEDAIETIRLGYAQRNSITVPRGMDGYNEDIPLPSQDLDKAKEHIEKSKYSIDEIELTQTHALSEEHRRIGQTMRQALKEIGVTVKVEKFPFPTQWSRARKLETAPNIFQILWGNSYLSPFVNLWEHYHSVPEGEKPVLNLAWANNEELDNLLLEANRELAKDREKGTAMLKEAQQKVYDLCYGINFYDLERIHPMRKEITGRPGYQPKGFKPSNAYCHTTFFRPLYK